MVNKDRLVNIFKILVEIDSVSKEEKTVSMEIKRIFEQIGAETFYDNSNKKTGSDTGNLIVKFDGNTNSAPLLLSAHMDTVEPGRKISVSCKNGMFTSKTDTVLGADDKSAIAIFLETMRIIKENNILHGPIEFVFTTCEEIGLLGAKNLDFGLIKAKYGYVLDTENTASIIIKAPAANRFKFKIHGQDAHAGLAPEKGINSIVLASQAISRLKLGRIDHETTCNIGTIEGGIATNIVPNLVVVKGEVRSHANEKLNNITDNIVLSFKESVEKYNRFNSDTKLPYLESHIENDFSAINIEKNHLVVTTAINAASNIGRTLEAKVTGGGADANIFCNNNIITGILGTGMRNCHTVREAIHIDDMCRTVELLLEIIRLHS